MISKEVKLIGRQILNIDIIIVDIIPTVEIGQTEQEGFLIVPNLLSYIVSYDITFSIDGLVHSQYLAQLFCQLGLDLLKGCIQIELIQRSIRIHA